MKTHISWRCFRQRGPFFDDDRFGQVLQDADGRRWEDIASGERGGDVSRLSCSWGTARHWMECARR